MGGRMVMPEPKSNFYNRFVFGPAMERGDKIVFITWEEDMRRNDGQLALRAKIAAGLQAAGMPAEQASAEATRRMLEIRQLQPGQKYWVDAGDEMIHVSIVERE
jgi:uncharacterized heparinase superfamily protein